MKEKNYRISSDQLLLMLLGDASERSAVASQVRNQPCASGERTVGTGLYVDDVEFVKAESEEH